MLNISSDDSWRTIFSTVTGSTTYPMTHTEVLNLQAIPQQTPPQRYGQFPDFECKKVVDQLSAYNSSHQRIFETDHRPCPVKASTTHGRHPSLPARSSQKKRKDQAGTTTAAGGPGGKWFLDRRGQTDLEPCRQEIPEARSLVECSCVCLPNFFFFFLCLALPHPETPGRKTSWIGLHVANVFGKATWRRCDSYLTGRKNYG
jgi:hypothetical protein